MLLKVTFLPVSCIILYLSFDVYPVSILRLENILCSLDLYLVQFFCLPTIIFFLLHFSSLNWIKGPKTDQVALDFFVVVFENSFKFVLVLFF